MTWFGDELAKVGCLTVFVKSGFIFSQVPPGQVPHMACRLTITELGVAGVRANLEVRGALPLPGFTSSGGERGLDGRSSEVATNVHGTVG